MNNHENTIKLICEKRGDEKINAFNCCGFCVCEIITDDGLEHNYDDEKGYWLLGFLKSKETLVAVFGEEMHEDEPSETADYSGVCEACGATIGETDRCFEYHHNQMGYELEEILKYYEEYLGGKE
jgi:hypothetical protein